MVSLPDEDQLNEDFGTSNGGHLYHVLAWWRRADGGVYVYAASTLSPSSAAAERWARDQMLIHHNGRGEPDVVSVMTDDEREQAVLDVRERIGE